MSTLREGFDTPRPSWVQEDSDLTVNLLAHDRSETFTHDGQFAERFQFVSGGLGNSVYFSLPLPKIPIYGDTEVSLYMRANQPGMKLLARVILPADIDPDTKAPSYLDVEGDSYSNVDRWQRLELDLLSAVERQARILRIQSRRKVDLEGAYIERLVVNLYGGGGEAEVFLDDLTITPVPESLINEFQRQQAGSNARSALIRDPSTPVADGDADTPAAARSTARVQLNGSRLTRDGGDWFPTILDAPGAYLDQAMPFGFDVVKVDVKAAAADPEQIERVAGMGALLMLDLGAGLGSGDPIEESPLMALTAATTFPKPEAVAFWSLGEGLGSTLDRDRRVAELQRTRTLVTGLRDQSSAFPKLTSGLVVDEFPKYALPGQNLDILGVDVQNWGTMMAPIDSLHYLEQRRNLTALWSLNAPHLAWIDAAPPRRTRAAVWGDDVPPAWGTPRVQPEQVRLAVYQALMAGYRGIGFRADADLTRAGGRSVLYELGMLNAEIDLIESILARAGEGGAAIPLEAYPTAPKRMLNFNTAGPQGSVNRFDDAPPAEPDALKSVKVVSIPSKDGRSRLVLIADLAGGAQWQPPQMAYNDVQVIVRGAPASAQAYQLTLGGRRVLETKNQEVGGIRFTLPEFDTATMVLLTTDMAMAEQLERELRGIRPRAVDLAIKQAQIQYEWVAEINGLLALDGVTVKDGNDLITKANLTLRSALDAVGRENYEEAWDEARRVSRSLRYLMREHWEAAVLTMALATNESLESSSSRSAAEFRSKEIPTVVPPIASPPAVAFNTLPQHYVWCDWVRHGTFGDDLLRGSGSFNRATPATLNDEGWTDASHRPDRVSTSIRLVTSAQAGMPAAPGSNANSNRSAAGAGTQRQRGQVLEMRAVPDEGQGFDRVAPYLDQPAVAIQSPPVMVNARQLVRIRVKVKMPREQPRGAGGLIVRDSLGGEPFQYRTTKAMNYFSEIVLYRRAAADGPMTVTLGLAGFGLAYFDDLRIEPLERYTPPSYAYGNSRGTYVPSTAAVPQPTPPRAAAALPLTPRTAR